MKSATNLRSGVSLNRETRDFLSNGDWRLTLICHLSRTSERVHTTVFFLGVSRSCRICCFWQVHKTQPLTALCIKLPHLFIDGMSQGISHKLIVWMATAIFTFSSWILINWLLDVSKALQHTHGTHWGGWCFKNWFCYLVEKFAEICKVRVSLFYGILPCLHAPRTE